MKSAAVFLALLISGVAHAKDGHGSHAAPAGTTGGWTGYKGTPRTYYRYTPPSSVPKTPQSAYAPVTSSTSPTSPTAGKGALKDAYRRVTSDQRMSKDYSAKLNQGISTGQSSLKTWSEKAKSRLK